MATKKQKKKTIALWPAQVTGWHVVVALSLLLNAAVVSLFTVMMFTPVFDDLILDRGTALACSQARQEVAAAKGQEAQAFLDYHCVRGEAEKYYIDGYNKYRESLGLKAIENQ